MNVWSALCVLFGLLFLRVDLLGTETTPHVLVSVAPYKFLVEKIAKDTITVDLMVPAGASAHTFEPTPKQMIKAGSADIWFLLGESFETKASQALLAHKPSLRLVDLRQNVDLITADPISGACCCCAGSQDLHIWLSCIQARIQSETIANALIAAFPQHKELYEKGLQSLKKDLQQLNDNIQEILKPVVNRVMMVSHPAYAYFCRDFHFKQLSIEIEGKDPTPKQLHTVLNLARALSVKKIFAQPQYSTKGAQLFAKELGAELIILDPYSEEYMQTMLTIAKRLAQDS